MFINFIAVFIGGGLGSVLRFGMGLLYSRFMDVNLPLATFSVNFLGSLIMGFAFVYFLDKHDISPAIKFAITVGFCGGLTTFSAFSMETFEMALRGHWGLAIGYSFISVLVCGIATMVGASWARYV